MARNVCKIIINNGLIALARSLEKILIDPDVNMGKIPEAKRGELIQRMADIDIAAFTGENMPKGGLRGVMMELADLGLVSDDVWKIYQQ